MRKTIITLAAGLAALLAGCGTSTPQVLPAVHQTVPITDSVDSQECIDDLIEYSDRVIQKLGKTLKVSAEISTASERRLDEINDELDAGMDQYLADLQAYNDAVDRCG